MGELLKTRDVWLDADDLPSGGPAIKMPDAGVKP